MKKQMVLTVMLILCIYGAQGANDGGKVSLDIIGSNANNTTFILPDGVPMVVDIIGSTVNNLQVGAGGNVIEAECRNCYECAACGELKVYHTPWDDFKRPLCYPWSSYIPTRYNKPMINWNQGTIGQSPVSLGHGTSANG